LNRFVFSGQFKENSRQVGCGLSLQERFERLGAGLGHWVGV
jgi:hypothetical protein